VYQGAGRSALSEALRARRVPALSGGGMATHEAEARAFATHPPRATLRTLLTLAWPIVVSRATQVVVGIADAVMVSHLGEAALAATTTGATNAFLLFILPMGIVFVVASFSSQLFGGGDPGAARRYGWYGLAVAGGAALLALLLIPAVPWVLGQFSYAEDVRRLMTEYLAIRLLSAGAVVGQEALASYYGGLGNTRLPMRASVVAMVLNVAGNWVLIDGHLGAPALGVRGAALASALASWCAFAGLAAIFVWVRRPAARVRLRAAELLRLLRFGLPSGLNWFLEFLAYAFFVNVVVAGLGTTSLAALMAVIQVNSVAFMPAFGLASAGAILVGQAIGAGRKDAVPRTVALTYGVACGWQVLAGIAYLAAPELILSPFARDPASAEALVAAGRGMLVLSAAWQIFDAGAATLGEALRAAGDTAFMLWSRVVVAWAVFAPGSWISARVLGAGERVAVGWLVLYIAVLALVLLLRFQSGAWRRIELVPGAPA
jgi:MATE family multidrug resistance protein